MSGHKLLVPFDIRTAATVRARFVLEIGRYGDIEIIRVMEIGTWCPTTFGVFREKEIGNLSTAKKENSVAIHIICGRKLQY